MNQNSLRRLTEATAFQGVVIALIIANAIIIGLETSATLMERMGTELHVIHITLQIAFIIEILLRILPTARAHGISLKVGGIYLILVCSHYHFCHKQVHSLQLQDWQEFFASLV